MTASKVGCAGILVVDTFCGPMASLPAEGSLLVLEDMPIKAGGCAANVAIDLARQAIDAEVIGCVGDDTEADLLLSTLETNRVCCSRVVRLTGHTTSKTVVLLIADQDRRYLHVVGANRAFTVDHIPREWLATLKVFYLGGLFAMPGIELQKLAALLEFCQTRKIITVLDVVIPQQMRGMTELNRLLPLIDVFVPNEDEARAFTGLSDPVDQLRALQSAGANTVLVTCGAKGVVAIRADRIWSCGTYKMSVIDPSGSGDAFTSGVIRGLLLEWDIPQILRYASAVGASATRSAGTTDSVFSVAEAEAFLVGNPMTVHDAS
jgi:sugar/nucleoside kinase (ribokinase family)